MKTFLNISLNEYQEEERRQFFLSHQDMMLQQKVKSPQIMGNADLGTLGCKYTGLVEILNSNAPDGKKEYQGICITKLDSFHRLE